jgi:hypothetical protein
LVKKLIAAKTIPVRQMFFMRDNCFPRDVFSNSPARTLKGAAGAVKAQADSAGRFDCPPPAG